MFQSDESSLVVLFCTVGRKHEKKAQKRKLLARKMVGPKNIPKEERGTIEKERKNCIRISLEFIQT